MRYLSQIFAPTSNRRLNELIGFLLCVSALLLFLALASYSPLDPSLQQRFGADRFPRSAQLDRRSWAPLVSDSCCRCFGIGAFLLPVFPAVLGARWFRSRKVRSPIAKIWAESGC